MKKTISLMLVGIMMFSFIGFVSADIDRQDSLQIDKSPKITKADPKPTLTRDKTNPTKEPEPKDEPRKKPKRSSSGGGCITKWGWDGTQWVKRDLLWLGKTIPGEACVAFNMHTRTVVSQPDVGSMPSSRDIMKDEPMPAGWFWNKANW